MATLIQYAGNRAITQDQAQKLRAVIDQLLERNKVQVRGEERMGNSLSSTMEWVREYSGLRNFPGNFSDQMAMFQALGYQVGEAHPPKKFSEGTYTAARITAVYL